ncbi:TPA: extracellular solute-binding protein [Streptococcus suis]|nr:extracellular solute-binding protein [Streptococcus suis]
MKMNGFKLAVVGLSCITFLAACSTNKESSSSEEMKLTIFDKNSGSKKFDDRIAQEIEKRTGVDIELQSPTGDAESKLSLMLSSRDYADIVIMDRSSDLVDKYISSGAFIELNDLIDEHGPNVAEMYGETLNKTRAADGKNYYLSNWYGESNQPVAAWNMRYDYMVEIVGKERADSPEPFTQSEMLDILRKFKEKHPEVDGKKSYGITIQENGLGVAGMFGIKTYYENDGKLFHQAKNPEFMKMITFLNQLYQEDLLDKEWVTNNDTLRNQKLSAGNMMGSISGYWDPQSVNDANRQAGKNEAVYVAYKVIGDGLKEDETTYGGRSSLGWDAIGITDNAKNPEAAMKVIDFLASREGQSLMLWGIEGEDYTVNDNGDYTPSEEILKQFSENREDATNNTGITRWTWFVNNQGPTENTPMRVTDYLDQSTFENKMAYQNMVDTNWDTAIYDDLTPDVSTPVGLKWQKISDIYAQAIPKMINATNESEAKKIYEQMLNDFDTAGIEEVEQAINTNYQERLKLWSE